MYSMYVSTQNTIMPDVWTFYVNLPMESLRREKNSSARSGMIVMNDTNEERNEQRGERETHFASTLS